MTDISAGSWKEEMEKRRAAIRPATPRIARLREESVQSPVCISTERARIITQFYKKNEVEKYPRVIQRALAFKYLLERVSLPVEEGQLIVGLRGTGPREVPTYPEICIHSPEDLETLNDRTNMPYQVDTKDRDNLIQKINPFWKGHTMREKIFSSLPPEWHQAYEAGIWTEFMEQRAPGHSAGGERIFQKGALTIKEEIREQMKALENQLPEKEKSYQQLQAMEIAADAIIYYARRYAGKLEKMAGDEEDKDRKEELKIMARNCRRVPAEPPRNFWEALQHYWFIHLGIVYETNPWDSFSPGRIDQHLLPFYRGDIEKNELNREGARELLQAFWIKFNNQPAVPKVGVTAEESFTYNDFSKLNLGGIKGDGSDGVNELSELILEVFDQIRTLQPNLAVLVSNKNPERFLLQALEVVSPGFGEPPFFNAEGAVIKMLRQGKTLEDARKAGVSGCAETGAFGQEAYILTGYFNLPRILEITLNNGVDPASGTLIGLETGDPRFFISFQELKEAFNRQVQYFLDIKMKGNDIIEKIYAREFPVPFMSLWIEDCAAAARDYNDGGARYNTQYTQVVGLGTLTSSLAAIKYQVYDRKNWSMAQILQALEENFAGEQETLQQVLLNRTPRYGEDDEYPDQIARDIVEDLIAQIESYPPTPVRQASRRTYFLPTTVHVYFGRVTGATPDGRKAGRPVSEGVSPVQGSDRKGITAVLRSVARCDWDKTGGALLNQKLTPDLLQGLEKRKKVLSLIKTFFNMGGHHLQFNIVSRELLREARKKPREFQDLMVRVAGYSDYFVNLPPGLQEEIIMRTEQGEEK